MLLHLSWLIKWLVFEVVFLFNPTNPNVEINSISLSLNTSNIGFLGVKWWLQGLAQSLICFVCDENKKSAEMSNDEMKLHTGKEIIVMV